MDKVRALGHPGQTHNCLRRHQLQLLADCRLHCMQAAQPPPCTIRTCVCHPGIARRCKALLFPVARCPQPGVPMLLPNPLQHLTAAPLPGVTLPLAPKAAAQLYHSHFNPCSAMKTPAACTLVFVAALCAAATTGEAGIFAGICARTAQQLPRAPRHLIALAP